MSHIRDIESQLRALEERRNLLDKKIEAKLDTITKFNQIKENSRIRLHTALDKQDEEARIRNAQLMKKIMSAPLSSSLIAQRKCIVDNEEKLNEAKATYCRQMETMLPAMHRNQAMLLEEKIRQIRQEKDLSIQRRARLNQELVYEERVKTELERQRRELLASLALEQQDIMQAHANAVMLAVDGAEADRLVYEQVENAGNDLRGLISSSLNRSYGTNLEDLRQQQRNLRALSTLAPSEQLYGRSNLTPAEEAVRSNSARPAITPQSASKQDRSMSQTSRYGGGDSSDVSFDRSMVVEQKVSEAPDTRYRMLVESPRLPEPVSTTTVAAGSSNISSSSSKGRPNLENSTPAEPVVSPRGDRIAVPVIQVPVKAAPPASVIASPTVQLPPPAPLVDISASAPAAPIVPHPLVRGSSVNSSTSSGGVVPASMRRDHSLYVSEDEFDEEPPVTARSTTGSSRGVGPTNTPAKAGDAATSAGIAAVGVAAAAAASATELSRVDSAESFPSIPEEPLPSPSKPPQPTVAESVAALQKVLSSTPDCVKCLKSLFATIENRIMFINAIGSIYLYTPLNVTDVGGNSHRNKLTEFLTLLLDPASQGSVKLEQYNDNDRLLGDMVMCILEAKAPLLIPKDAFMGVMTLDKLKKEHKKLTSPGPILEMWDCMTSHLQKLVEANSTYLTTLSMTFTSVLISHISPEDKDRLQRKVSSLLQLAMIPPSSEGNRSPEPPYRANSRRLEETSSAAAASSVAPVEQSVKLSNRFNDVAAASAAVPAAPVSRPLLTSKTSSKFAYDSMQLPTNTASEFDDEEFLAEDSFQVPPSMKDLDELHSGGAGNRRTSNTSGGGGGGGSGGAQRGGSARVVQVGGGKGRANNRDLDTSSINDEFDF